MNTTIAKQPISKNFLHGVIGDEQLALIRKKTEKSRAEAIRSLGKDYVGHPDQRIKRLDSVNEVA